ncbi:MAG TPA: hypothetical protein VH796_04010 [Nitrososphaeraceae archaeon]|jgi:hypothetical protein
MVDKDEHIIKCSICGRGLIVKDTVNDGMAFLSHLKIDHRIVYTFQRMTTEAVRTPSTSSKTVQNQKFTALE